MDWQNVWTAPLFFNGAAYEPGATIPATVDPVQLRYFAAQGIVVPLTAPASSPHAAPGHVSPPTSEEVTDGDDGTE